MDSRSMVPSDGAPDGAGVWLAVRWSRVGVGRGLLGAAVFYVVALAAMMALLGAAAPPPRFDPAFAADAHRFALYRLTFVCAFLLAPALFSMLVLLLVARGAASVRDVLGVLILATYPPLSSLAYASQWTLLPRLLDRHPAAAASWYFHDSHSIPYSIDLLGYTLFGLAATLLSVGFLARRGVWRWAGGLLLASGLTSILAFAALGARLERLHLLATLTSGTLTVPLAVAAALVGRGLRGGSGSGGDGTGTGRQAVP
jgi:hypothetical protein